MLYYYDSPHFEPSIFGKLRHQRNKWVDLQVGFHLDYLQRKLTRRKYIRSQSILEKMDWEIEKKRKQNKDLPSLTIHT